MFGYYLHIPFCEKKCTYCDFYSIESTGLIERFIAALKIEIALRGTQSDAGGTGMPLDAGGRGMPWHAPTARSIFFGGGTPSLLTPLQLSDILDTVRRHVDLSDDCEITMECNPGTITLEKLEGYRAAGVNRLSFGVQSFIEEELRFLTRIHTAEQADEAMALARAAGFTNVNMDLMFALPPQTMDTLAFSLSRLLALQPDHISAYSLIFEPGTPLNAQKIKGLVVPHEEELDADMYAYVMRTLREAGYEQYEVSNFAKPGHRCRHNLTYWHGEDYVGVGPSAHGLLNGTRYWNHRSLTSWLQLIDRGELPEANTETLTREDRITELAFLTLRADGMPIQQFNDEFSIDLRTRLQPDLDFWIGEGLIEDTGTHLRLTERGYQVCDVISVNMRI
ncbi:MAG: radical SAM family heme chaperone HemW [Ignavibacteriae bacterium]|nr:MAG: radical SAM family heme chaperone HemW [Ignavibacteriota bacterium]